MLYFQGMYGTRRAMGWLLGGKFETLWYRGGFAPGWLGQRSVIFRTGGNDGSKPCSPLERLQEISCLLRLRGLMADTSFWPHRVPSVWLSHRNGGTLGRQGLCGLDDVPCQQRGLKPELWPVLEAFRGPWAEGASALGRTQMKLPVNPQGQLWIIFNWIWIK